MNKPTSRRGARGHSASRLAHSFALLIVLFLIWLLWSGHFETMLICFGIGSCVFVLMVCLRMNIVDDEGVPVRIGLRPHVYSLWLIKQIVLANIDVARRVLHPKLPISPKIIRVKTLQKSELGRVIFANSITLTPGTVSIDAQGNEIEIHALSAEAAEEVLAGEMNRRVAKLEGTE